jgi:hypothetical protein
MRVLVGAPFPPQRICIQYTLLLVWASLYRVLVIHYSFRDVAVGSSFGFKLSRRPIQLSCLAKVVNMSPVAAVVGVSCRFLRVPDGVLGRLGVLRGVGFV